MMKFIDNALLGLLFPLCGSTLNRISKLILGILIDWIKCFAPYSK